MSDVGPGLHAVVADDEPRMRELLAGVLAREGFEVAQASNGLEALDFLRNTRVDMLVSDILMPGLDGLAVIELAQQISPRTASIVITGQASLSKARGATQGGAADFLPKPFSQRELLDAVRGALTRKTAAHERERERELADLFELSEAVRDTHDHREFLQLTLAAAVAQTGSDVGWIACAEGNGLRLMVTAPAEEEEGEPRDLLDTHVLSQAAKGRKPLLLYDQPDHPLAESAEVLAPGKGRCHVEVTEAIAFPVTAAKELVGAIGVGHREENGRYTKGDFQLLSVLASQAGLLIKNAGLLDDLERAYVGTVRSMALMVEARDRYTHGHSRRVADICGRLAREFEVSPEEANTLEVAAGLHDIGKVAVPDVVLNKPGKLTEKEWLSIRLHPVVGAEVLSPASFLTDARPLVLHHHERYDGGGYPDKLNNSGISLLTHMIIGADAWDAMTSRRPYRPALTNEEALREIERERGAQFHPQIADALVGMFGGGA